MEIESPPTPVRKYEKGSRTISVIGTKGRRMEAAIADSRVAISTGTLASHIGTVTDDCDESVQYAIGDLYGDRNVTEYDENVESEDSDSRNFEPLAFKFLIITVPP